MEFHGFLLLIGTLFFTLLYPQPMLSMPHNNSTDLSALLGFKAAIDDPTGILATSWTPSISFCAWIGISCSHRRQRVTALVLNNMSLQGTISPHLANLSFLSRLDLHNNSLSGPIPDGLGRLHRLRWLSLQRNQLSGPIPPAIFNLSSLNTINLFHNNLSGSLPKNHSFFLPQLRLFVVESNQLSGTIPSSLGRCLDLQFLSLSTNHFTGTIPVELTNLQKLIVLYLDHNKLNGTIPDSLNNLTKLTDLDLSVNFLSGEIPSGLGGLQSVQWLVLGTNSLTGPIPASLWNASTIEELDLSINSLTGPVPIELGRNMPFLTSLHLGGNYLSGGLDFITSLSNCRVLENLHVEFNELDGVLPASVANLSSNLLKFTAYNNHIIGQIPAGLANLSSLVEVYLMFNELTGKIPTALTRMEGLQELDLVGNRIHGPIPSELGQLGSLDGLALDGNLLSGLIPVSVGNISGLQLLSLAANSLSSAIPHSLWSLSSLLELNLSGNFFEGSLPPDVGNLKSIDVMDLSANQFSGIIPSAIGQLQMLEFLDMSHNLFQGPIPQTFGGLISIKYLNLSSNDLTGAIPRSLANLRYLTGLNLSFNRLEGKIPNGSIFSNLTIQSLKGNAGLCGAPKLGFPPCPENATVSNPRGRHVLKVALTVSASMLLLVACFSVLLVLLARRRRKKTTASTHPPSLNDHRLISYHELIRATDDFSEANLLGRGSFGSVFRGRLDDGLDVAVKVLNLEMEAASRSFDAECRALRVVRHRNLIKIISTCSNLDFKALVLQYMPNGSLEKWLHSHNYCLSLLQRINIMLDVASALEYLHHHHPQVVLHCDLKPSNVLLDEDMNAHLGDFGIAKLLLGDSKSMVSASTPGTIGYIAPEYGSTGRVSRSVDVYSYGILLLEIITRKKPTDAMFEGESSLRNWVFEAHPTAVLDIVDNNLFKDEQADPITRHQCLSASLELGLLCSKDSPKDRILMKDVVPRLQKIKKNYLSKQPRA
uniref:non-specific serine/threonine protein kinase n=1 Tax=Elaeis guineensis var. tenera TaxID=51953 RepID=A0A6I9SHL1_ELAGV|nr:probable LRR receptor-like serine/threonine-protein kinase At3g47570 [Elaeis guineensis]